jgi:hypothetical protein
VLRVRFKNVGKVKEEETGARVCAAGVWYALSENGGVYARSSNGSKRSLKDPEKLFSSSGPADIIDASGEVFVISHEGVVARVRSGSLESIRARSKVFGLRNNGPAIAWDSARSRIVAYGGYTKGKNSNDTLFFHDKDWQLAKRPSPRPNDRSFRNIGAFRMVFDTAVGMLRLGAKDSLALLDADDDVWRPLDVPGYKKLGKQHHLWGDSQNSFYPFHDAETQQTLLFNPTTGAFARFDVDRCVQVATVEPIGKVFPGERTASLFDPFNDSLLEYDAREKMLYMLLLSKRYALSLAPVFEAAKALGPRKLPKKARASSQTMSHEALLGLVGVESRAIKVGKTIKGKLPRSRLGGAPSVDEKSWPTKNKNRMGFLFQIETGKLLGKHAGLAVFCTVAGKATEDASENAVVLLRDLDHACASKEAALPARALELEAAKIEIDDARVAAAVKKDRSLGVACEELRSAKGMQREDLTTKLGGVPQFLQEEQHPKKHRFVCQLDFDSIDVKGWPSAGLSGCIYVFVHEDESSACAFWQTT